MDVIKMQLERKYISEIRIDKPVETESYIIEIPAIKYLLNNHSLKFNKNITIFVGENGTGKSTLLEAIAAAIRLNPEGGSGQHSFSTMDTHSDLHRAITVVKEDFPRDKYFLRAESIYNVASYVREAHKDDYSNWVDLHKMSHGESFLNIVKNFRGKGLYLMDEPEAALSPSKLLEAMCIMNDLLNKESQFIISTHSPILMAFPDAQILQLTANGIEEVNYRDTEHYQITTAFLQNPDRMLKIMFEQ